jgi:glutamate--cysteine ligase
MSLLYQQLQQRIQAIQASDIAGLLKHSKIGLEKESLRVSEQGGISQTDHPAILGSALTHSHITTDYSEALLELVTPPCQSGVDALDFLLDVETFVYQQIENELLWTNSMPCVLGDGSDIRIAEYGNSNAGRMKHIYRHGLAWRYGKIMQVIAGIHFNYSVAEAFWPAWYEQEKTASSFQHQALQSFINERYMAMTRNIQRYGWLIPYLFGSSPTICKSFLAGTEPPPNMKTFDAYTLYEPGGTSLRMGDIGYTNRKESKVGIKADYNSLEKYTDSLECAITTPSPQYESIGVQDEQGNYRQLNANILQIENEYYSSVRPKQVLQGFERPIDALRKRGVQYVELRSVDINPFHPAGLSRKQLYFLETFMLFCVLQESPALTALEQDEIDSNQSLVAHQGRLPGLKLMQQGQVRSLQDWGSELLQQMRQVAELLDKVNDKDCYTASLDYIAALIPHPELTPSARVLEEMQANNECFFSFAWRQSQSHKDWFLQQHLSAEKQQYFQTLATESLQKQQEIEAEPQIPFEHFLNDYFAGKATH